MKKIPVTERNKQMKQSASASSIPSSVPSGADGDEAQSEAQDPTAGLQADLDRFRDLAARSQADFENYKKRSAREKEEAIKYANKSLLERLVGIIDNFELGLAAAKEQGAQPIEAEAKTFDPNLHEAIAHEPSNEYPEGIVVRQTRRGYRFKDRLLRPAKVFVSSGPAK